jgi:anthranilate synthase component I
MPEANVIPVIRRLFSGTESPLGLYEKLCGKRPNTFLLESAEQGVWGRFSFVGVQSRGQLVAEDSGVSWVSEHPALPNSQVLPSDPVEALETLQRTWISESADFPLSSGLVGFAGWGLTELIEHLPPKKSEDYRLPLFGFNQFSELVVLDHQSSELILVSVVFLDGESSKEQKIEAANRKLDLLQERIAEPTRARLSEPKWPEPQYSMRSTKSEFLTAVETAKHHVRLGDVFQVVISQRFDQQVTADALDVYSSLRAINPSPYMYLTRWQDEQGEFAIVGSSPEALIKVSGESVVTHPIAGSRPRGKDSVRDEQLAEDLLADAKERSEHLMLVDLARNDLLKVCEPSSLSVSEFMEIHRFSHIMHLVSTVEGKLRKDTSLVRSLLATFPAGTLSGAPKPRALEIIHDLEPTARGLFGGVVGYFDFQGNADLAIAIRTALIRDGVARIQAGAGIVLDSDPESEYQETLSKAAVVLRAVASANEMTK